MKRELQHMGAFLARPGTMAARWLQRPLLDRAQAHGANQHQYDFDAATVIGFLKSPAWTRIFKLNIEANHATLAGHSFQHELQVCADAGLLGSIDATGGRAERLGIRISFPSTLTTGGSHAGGPGSRRFRRRRAEFDAKVRRNSTDLQDLFLGHIGAWTPSPVAC